MVNRNSTPPAEYTASYCRVFVLADASGPGVPRRVGGGNWPSARLSSQVRARFTPVLRECAIETSEECSYLELLPPAALGLSLPVVPGH